MKLSVEFFQFNNVVYGKIIDQDPLLRSTADDRFQKLIIMENEFSIFSRTEPKLDDTTLYIKGGIKESDEKGFCYAYPSAEMADVAVKNFKKLIEKVNNG